MISTNIYQKTYIQIFAPHYMLKFVILLTVNHAILIMLIQRIILVLDQLIIPTLIFFFILITCLLDIVLIL